MAITPISVSSSLVSSSFPMGNVSATSSGWEAVGSFGGADASQELDSRIRAFGKALKSLALQGASSAGTDTALQRVLEKAVREPNAVIKGALTKQEGYLKRFFSNETWQEWSQSRTALGRVVDHFFQNMNHFASMERLASLLDVQTIQQANQEAAQLPPDENSISARNPSPTPASMECSTGLLLGTATSFALQNPVPLGISAFNCLPMASARETTFQNHITLEPGESKYFECNRKIYLCKKKENVCGYHGPDLHITVIKNKDKVLYDGTFGGEQSWGASNGATLSIEIKNTAGSGAAMYVHIEDW